MANQIYFTADLHFGHTNILKHSPNRPYSDTVDIQAHDEWLLDLKVNSFAELSLLYRSAWSTYAHFSEFLSKAAIEREQCRILFEHRRA